MEAVDNVDTTNADEDEGPQNDREEFAEVAVEWREDAHFDKERSWDLVAACYHETLCVGRRSRGALLRTVLR